MQYRTLGRTGIKVSAIAFGAGPVSGLMTGVDANAQRDTVAAAIEAGINWFDTAPGYGAGSSEINLGRVLSELKPTQPIHIATKVRIPLDSAEPVSDVIRRSVEECLQRLRVSSVILLQLHNGITSGRGDEAASITPTDILARGGVADTFERLREEGLIRFSGLTATGQPAAMKEVIRSGRFDTVQAPYNAINHSAGSISVAAGDTDYGNLFADCAEQRMGVFAIRVFAAGALLGQAPSAHTLKTPYFPLDLYQRDVARAEQLRAELYDGESMTEFALRFVLSHSAVTSAIIGFGSPSQVGELDAVVGHVFNVPVHSRG
ncbi:MAG: putative aldoketoreductase [Planctomycetota bacterium]|nr:MAG: putative aldoketoreductase [Planctomycetota bacterium]